ncbi:TraX family protein [Paraburkholderia sp. A3RO-2L]|uniref:TraX family protein n=1 Tax=Paraburkholderia sp. A3RO-2L TaxID=3028376 RepID=UPI003DA9E58C
MILSTFIARYGFRVQPVSVSPGQLDLLKLLAFLSMVTDHVNKALLHEAYPAMELLGRFAFPLFAWSFAYTFVHHLRNGKRFVATCLLFALVTQWPFYQVLVNHTPGQFRLGSLNILAAFLFAFSINRLWCHKGKLAEMGAYVLFGGGGLLCLDVSYAWQGIGLLLCCVGLFRTGGALYAVGCVFLLALCLVPNVFMAVPILIVLVLFSGITGFGTGIPRFLPRYSLYIGYAGHVWLLYLLSGRFHW